MWVFWEAMSIQPFPTEEARRVREYFETAGYDLVWNFMELAPKSFQPVMMAFTLIQHSNARESIFQLTLE